LLTCNKSITLKKRTTHTIRSLPLLIILLFGKSVFSQGRVVINEYMPWTLNGCGATSEFVELLNFGPGPVDISCYILTDGDYSITIPQEPFCSPANFL